MANYRLIFLLFSLLVSSFTKLIAQDSSAVRASEIFTEHKGKYMYRAHISIEDQELTGLLMIKKYATGHYRLAMVNELGLGIFDMEFFADADTPFVVHSINEMLNKKQVINILREDFESICVNFAQWEKVSDVKMERRYHYRGKRIYQLNAIGQIQSAELRKWGFWRHKISLEPTKNPYPASLFISHRFTSLSILLTFVQ